MSTVIGRGRGMSELEWDRVPEELKGRAPGAMRRLAFVLAAAAAVLALAAPGALAALPPVKHVWVIVLENKGYDETFGPSSPAPYLARTLPAQGQLLTQYYGTGHHSLDNYISMISGQAPTIETQADCPFYHDVLPGLPGPDGQFVGQGCVYPAATPTLANQLAAKGRRWKGYMEGMGTACRHPDLNSQDTTQSGTSPTDQYAAKHNPFVYFHSIIDTPACAANDVPLTKLNGDLASPARSPAYAMIVPDLCEDGHDAPCADGRPGGLVSADAFLRHWVPRIMSSPAYADNGMIVVTFDEAESG